MTTQHTTTLATRHRPRVAIQYTTTLAIGYRAACGNTVHYHAGNTVHKPHVAIQYPTTLAISAACGNRYPPLTLAEGADARQEIPGG